MNGKKDGKKFNYDDFPIFVFHQGRNYKAQEFFGAHRADGDTFVFRVWAPHAKSVSVVGDFNNWETDASPMEKLNDEGVWECFCDNVKVFDCYKFLITAESGRRLYKADPYAVHAETRPGTASKIYESSFEWNDSESEWSKKRVLKELYLL